MLQRLASRAAVDQRGERPRGRLRHPVPSDRGRLNATAGGAEDMGRKQLGVDLGVGHSRCVQSLRGGAHGIRDGNGDGGRGRDGLWHDGSPA
ncbi:hypothetical protein MTE01_05080 [Microbacterium testaceum]|uniref:Uncharacterized protein n=1 Tax=Microbacterium testaceum TaxID=2033 RepID=A0A4Y3QIR7_MICTE|nr:hypothetical protein MTE01_05080 [Microbacterium testaceum]